MILQNKHKKQRPSLNTQKGATLMTSLIFLVLMTVVSISATKVSIMDVLVSGNNQQEMMLYQLNENELKKFSTIASLEPLLNNGNDNIGNNPADINQFIFDDAALLDKGLTQKITDYSNGGSIPSDLYACARGGTGLSMGPNAPPCRLFDFEINARVQGTSARDVHHKGLGKMVPNANKGALL